MIRRLLGIRTSNPDLFIERLHDEIIKLGVCIAGVCQVSISKSAWGENTVVHSTPGEDDLTATFTDELISSLHEDRDLEQYIIDKTTEAVLSAHGIIEGEYKVVGLKMLENVKPSSVLDR